MLNAKSCGTYLSDAQNRESWERNRGGSSDVSGLLVVDEAKVAGLGQPTKWDSGIMGRRKVAVLGLIGVLATLAVVWGECKEDGARAKAKGNRALGWL